MPRNKFLAVETLHVTSLLKPVKTGYDIVSGVSVLQLGERVYIDCMLGSTLSMYYPHRKHLKIYTTDSLLCVLGVYGGWLKITNPMLPLHFDPQNQN